MRRQWRVDLIVALWPIMPMRWKAWAFLNDGYDQEAADRERYIEWPGLYDEHGGEN